VIFKTLVVHLLCLLSIVTLTETDAKFAGELLKEQNPNISKDSTFDRKNVVASIGLLSILLVDIMIKYPNTLDIFIGSQGEKNRYFLKWLII